MNSTEKTEKLIELAIRVGQLEGRVHSLQQENIALKMMLRSKMGLEDDKEITGIHLKEEYE